MGLVPNNKHVLCFKPQERFFFDPRHPNSFCFYLLCAQSSQLSLHLSTAFLGPKLMFWVGEGREKRKGMQSIQMHSSLAGVAFFRLRGWCPLIDTETRFCCNLWGKGKGDAVTPSSLLPLTELWAQQVNVKSDQTKTTI